MQVFYFACKTGQLTNYNRNYGCDKFSLTGPCFQSFKLPFRPLNPFTPPPNENSFFSAYSFWFELSQFFNPIWAHLACFSPGMTVRHSFFHCFRNTQLEMHLLEGPDKNTPLVRESRKRRKKPSNRRDLNPQPLDYEACALLLCYNHSPVSGYFMFSSRSD